MQILLGGQQDGEFENPLFNHRYKVGDLFLKPADVGWLVLQLSLRQREQRKD